MLDVVIGLVVMAFMIPPAIAAIKEDKESEWDYNTRQRKIKQKK